MNYLENIVGGITILGIGFIAGLSVNPEKVIVGWCVVATIAFGTFWLLLRFWQSEQRKR